MTERLRALLVGAAIFIGVGGTFSIVYNVVKGVTQEDLADAGVSEGCARQDIECQAIRRGGYVLERIGAYRCVDPANGEVSFILPPDLQESIPDVLTWCRPIGSSELAAGSEKEVPFNCACSSGDDCTKASSHRAVPIGVTMQPGTWEGRGCVPKACIEIAGRSSWPAGCPQ